MQAGTFRIITGRVVRHPGMERNLIERNRDVMCYYLIMAGCILLLFGVVW